MAVGGGTVAVTRCDSRRSVQRLSFGTAQQSARDPFGRSLDPPIGRRQRHTNKPTTLDAVKVTGGHEDSPRGEPRNGTGAVLISSDPEVQPGLRVLDPESRRTQCGTEQ